MSKIEKRTLIASPHEHCDCDCMHIWKRLGQDCDKCDCIACHVCHMFIIKTFWEQHQKHCSSKIGSPKY